MTRANPDLDAVFGIDSTVENVNEFPRKRPKVKRKREPGSRDLIRRKAFKVLALLADLTAKQRMAVLKAAERLNRA